VVGWVGSGRIIHFDSSKLEGGLALLDENEYSCKINGVGTKKFCLHCGTNRVLEEVKFVPSLKDKVKSPYEITKKGYAFKDDKGCWVKTSSLMKLKWLVSQKFQN